MPRELVVVMGSEQSRIQLVDSQKYGPRTCAWFRAMRRSWTIAIRNLIAPAIMLALISHAGYAQDLFSQLNLDLPGLASVRSAAEKKNFKTAERELLQYFRTRTNRTFDRFTLRGDSAKAYQFSRNRIFLRDQLVDFGSAIDWRKTGIDREWNYSLNRMAWLVEYAAVYDAHPDEKLVQAFVEQVRSWIRGTGSPGFPRTIDTGNRLYYWCIAHWYFVQHNHIPGITPEFNVEMLKSMAAQAEFLYAPEHWRRFSNWGTFENAGLAYFAIMFPEFKRSQEWMNEIRFRVHFQLTNSYYADGFHTEVSPSYHAAELEVLLGIALASEDNHIPLGIPSQASIPSVKSLIRKPAEALMYMLQPNGTTPNVGDTDEENERKLLRALSGYLGRDDMKFVATAGESGKAPEYSSAAFPNVGYYVMRSGWGSKHRALDQEMYLLFDNGLNRPWHSHYDQLNIVAYANGQPLLRDAGKYTYNEDADRAYFKGTSGHNTIVIDSLDQPAENNPAPARWITTHGFDFVSGVGPASNNASSRRSVLFVKPEYWIVMDRMSGDSPHCYEQFWHLDAAIAKSLRHDPRTNQLQTPAMVLASPMSESSYVLGEGWFSPRYRERTKAPLLKRSEIRTGSLTWSTVIMPYTESKPEIKVERIAPPMSSGGQEPAALKVTRGTTTDFFVERDTLDGRVSFEGLATDGSVLFVRRETGGGVPAFFLAEGSFILADNDTIVAFNHLVESAFLLDGELTVETSWPVAVMANGAWVQSIRINQEPVEFKRERQNVRYDGDRLRR